MTNIPTSKDVIAFLNERLAARGLPHRVDSIEVLPYVNPMWLSNWNVPQLANVLAREGDIDIQEIIEEEIREARWRFPQVLDEF
ncbi:MAG: hypothetical protein DMF56_19815 [Acidobacteria bacterium]|nr:MAG: hypothetical protein DMF56_19815 [Acidobacteriota bacterium]